MQGTTFPAGAWGLESRARCAGFSVTEIGNRKERVRDYASFPDQSPKRVWAAVQRNPRFPYREAIQKARIRERSDT